jgi:hypothetical protein
MTQHYFVTYDLRKSQSGARVVGQIVTDGTLTVSDGGGGGGGGSAPPIKPVDLFEPKWILPPRESPAYGAIKSTAESMGYETVEHDDFSYPPPRS